ncbi:MAG: PilZ domain-containing protein [Nitrospiraceae bacterium]
MAKTPREQRKHPRVPVQFRSHFSSRGQMIAGDGELKDLSPGGCRIHTGVEAPVGTRLEVCLFSHPEAAPLLVDEAIVRWVQPGSIGLEFSQVRAEPRRRLLDLCRRLAPIT